MGNKSVKTVENFFGWKDKDLQLSYIKFKKEKFFYHLTISGFFLQLNNKLFTVKMLWIIYEMEKLVDLKPVNLIQRTFNF